MARNNYWRMEASLYRLRDSELGVATDDEPREGDVNRVVKGNKLTIICGPPKGNPFDWSTATPGTETWEALQTAQDGDFETHQEGTEYTGEDYSRCALRAAWRLLQVAKADPERFASWDGWTSDELAREATADLGLTGFQFGWAINALRQMMELEPVADGATVILGGADTVRAMPGSALQEMHRAIGGGA